MQVGKILIINYYDVLILVESFLFFRKPQS
jgi:hypothetical protein